MKTILKIIRNILILCLIIIVGVASFVTYKGYEKYKTAINEIAIEQKIEEIKSNKTYTTLEEMPKIYKDAVVATEDRRFYDHTGIDIISLGRAIFTDIRKKELAEGGSTITQQLAKNSYFTQEASATRKIAEVFMAQQYEKNCSKDEILEYYLNTCYFGDGCYSVKEASKKYFEKEPLEMSDYECIMLAGIPNAPSVYAPTKNPDLAMQRAKQVLYKMKKYGYLTEEQVNKIKEENGLE
ncbi:MAG: transglycosylase domain-containing protein [Clostridia bacterium]|nr:transglycosylase domain-containing protein [Clostridia bacterium]